MLNSTHDNDQAAIFYAQLHDPNKAILWLEKTYERRSSEILSLKVDPDMDPLRSDARFQELTRRVGLP